MSQTDYIKEIYNKIDDQEIWSQVHPLLQRLIASTYDIGRRDGIKAKPVNECIRYGHSLICWIKYITGFNKGHM